MKKIAIIDRIENDVIFATYNKNDTAGHSKAFFKVNEDLSFKIKNSRKLPLNSGDSVEIFIEPKSAISLSFFMFIMPLIVFIASYSLVGAISQNIAEFVKILTGITGIVLSFGLTYLFYSVKPQNLPETTRVLTVEEKISLTCSSSSCGSCTSCG